MPNTPDGHQAKGRIPSLDGWRAVSIALVLGMHCIYAVGFPQRFAAAFAWMFDGNLGVRFFAKVISGLTRTHITDTSSGLRLMRAGLTGTVTQTQPQYQTSELLIGALLQGYRVAEVPTVMRQRMSGESRKGRNFAYGLRYARVITQTYLRERRTSNQIAKTVAQPAAEQAQAASTTRAK